MKKLSKIRILDLCFAAPIHDPTVFAETIPFAGAFHSVITGFK